MCLYALNYTKTNELLPLIFSNEDEAKTELDLLCSLYTSTISDKELLINHIILYSKRIFVKALFNKLNHEGLLSINNFSIVKYEDPELTKAIRIMLHKKLETLFIF